MRWTDYLWVGAGSALGGMLRFFVSQFFAQRLPGFPLGTLLVNISGSFLIGFLGAWVISAEESQRRLVVQFLMIGLLGGYTTFSAFSLQTWELFAQGRWWHGSLNIIFSVAGCLAAVGLGTWTGGWIRK